MKIVKYTKTGVFVISLLFLSLSIGLSAHAKNGVIDLNNPEAKKIVLAKIGDTPITVGELVKFAKSSPTFYGFLQIPGGPDRLVRELVLEKLLIKEGKALKIPEPTDQNESLYLLKVKKKLLPPLPPITEEEAKRYYQEHPEEFSTPLYLRLSQIKVYFDEKNRKQARKKIEKALKELKNGVPFATVVKRFSEEPISRDRGGDIGFIPSTSIGTEEVRDKILELKKGQISDILVIGNSFTIVMLTDKREPITDPYQRVKELAKEKAIQAREKARLERLRSRLEKKYRVTYLDY